LTNPHNIIILCAWFTSKKNQENCPRFTLMATDHHNFNISEHWSNATQNNNFFLRTPKTIT